MSKKSGLDPVGRPLPGGGGGVRAIGDAFRPNLAMGGGSYRIPLDLPRGAGGASPKLDLVYHTGLGNGPFGLGWTLSVPYVERVRPSPFQPDVPEEYTLSGAERLVTLADGSLTPAVGSEAQRIRRDGDGWISRTPELIVTRFGSTADSRLEAVVDGVSRTVRWWLSEVEFPGGMRVAYEYEQAGTEHVIRRIRWSTWRLELEYEPRPDPFSIYSDGFEAHLARRCRRVALHHDDLAPETLIRAWELAYETAPHVGHSLLHSITLRGWHRDEAGEPVESSLAPVTFGYTRFAPEERRIERFESTTVPPPPLGDDVTLLDYLGTSLPGVLRLDGDGGTYWENRGGSWGPPEPLRGIPAGIRVGDDGVRLADLTGNGTADLLIGDSTGGEWWEHDPARGFTRRHSLALAPGFAPEGNPSRLLDLDGDGIVDLLVVRDGHLLGFVNEDRGDAWSGPHVLPRGELPPRIAADSRVRFADVNGDGLPDVTLLRSRDVVYWPALGGGRWGAAQHVADTPDFDVPDPDADVVLADVDGDGTADLVLVGRGRIRIFLNQAGERFGSEITLERTPRLPADRFLLADLTGSGTAGFLWTLDPAAPAPGGYLHLDLLAAVKPYLLDRIDGGNGLTTDIRYSTSAAERARDLAEGVRWNGYLPFPVQVVTGMTLHDAVTGESSDIEFRYHDGNFDGLNREWLGFGHVESLENPGSNQDAVLQRYWFHNGADLAFDAGRGQPYRTEVIDPATGVVHQVDESEWRTLPVEAAHLAVEAARTSRRLDGETAYATERIEYQHDAIGNIVREHRRGEWSDRSGTPHVDELVVETTYAAHADHGTTSLPCRIRKLDGRGRMLKSIDFFYDGPAFTGLPFGQLTTGFRTRQTEVALAPEHIADAYGGTAPELLASLYREEVDPALGRVWVKDTRRYRVDASGNQLETLDALGHRVTLTYDARGVNPTSVREDGGPPRALTFDPISQQATEIEDANGNVLRTRFNAFGEILEVYRRGAHHARPTEVYEYDRSVVPHVRVQRVRVQAEDVEAGWERRTYLDGGGRTARVRTRTADGGWAVGVTELLSVRGRKIGERDAYFSASSDFEPLPPAGVATRETHYDFAGRILRERLYGGQSTAYRYAGPEASFYDPEAAAALAVDATATPSRTSRTDAWDRIVSVVEHDDVGAHEERREYDAIGQLVRIVNALGGTALESTLDGWGNRIRVHSAEAGTTVVILDAGNREVLRTDADGRVLYKRRDAEGRVTELHAAGATGPVLETRTYGSGTGANLIGRLATVSGDFGTVAYSYSPEGDPIRVTHRFSGDPTEYVVEFTYDTQRNVRSVRYPDGSVVGYDYTPDGLLTRIDGVIDDIEYGPEGKRRRIVFGNGLETRREFTPGDHLLREIMTAPSGGGPAYQHLVHHLDAIGRVTAIDDLSGVPGKVRNNQTFAYDGRNRLVGATGRGPSADYAFEYRYDPLGNLSYSSEAFGEEVDHGHDLGDVAHPNRLVKRHSALAPEYTYDASGNLTHDPAVGDLTYDVRHRLVRVDRPDGTVVEYDYDHTDRRVRTRITRSGTTTTRLEVEGIYIVEPGRTTRVVIDEDRRLAVLPSTGDGLLHHLDRLGNVNVVSNLATGAFVGHDEYTPWGQLSISVVIQPHYSYQGTLVTDGLDLVLLGVRWYRPVLGRFLTPDRWLMSEQGHIPGILGAANLYLYALDNPTNFTDPTGRIAFLAVLLIAAAVGAVLGAIGAAVNGVKTWDEFLLWVVGGAIGGVLSVLCLTGIVLGVSAIFGLGATLATASYIALGIYAVAGLLGAILTPLLDNTDSEVAWAFSFAIKVIQSPITGLVGGIATAIVAMSGGNVDFRRGMVFIEVGPGGGALTLGAFAWTQSGRFGPDGKVPDDLAKHESQHSRTVAAIGELGFYFTYVTVGAIWGAAECGTWSCWNDLNGTGCGNPFEKTAHTFTGDPATAAATGSTC